MGAQRFYGVGKARDAIEATSSNTNIEIYPLSRNIEKEDINFKYIYLRL